MTGSKSHPGHCALRGLLAALLALAASTNVDGALFTDPQPSPDFSLHTPAGATFRLHDRAGRVVVLYFGYTHCPDVCSRTMAILKSTLDRMTPGERADIDVVFISLDPARDAGPSLARFLARFDRRFIGLVPRTDQLDALMRDYNLLARTLPGPDPEAYSIVHTDLVFAVDRAGLLRMAFLTGTGSDVMARDLRTLLQEAPPAHAR